jgi:hypothetical protein
MSDVVVELEFAENVGEAISAARLGRLAYRPLSTGPLLAALAEADVFGDWGRVWLPCGFPSLDDLRGATDPGDGARDWDGCPVSTVLAGSLELLAILCRRYDMGIVQPGVFALALLSDPASAASVTLLAQSEITHDELLLLSRMKLSGPN